MLMSKENERSSEQAPQQLPLQKSANMLGDFQVDDEIGIFDLVDYVVEFLPYTPANARAVKSLSKAWRFAAMMAFHWEGTLYCKKECCCMLLNPTKLQRPGADEDAWCCNELCEQFCACNIPNCLKDEEELKGQIGGYPSFEFLGIDLGHCHNSELSCKTPNRIRHRIPNISRVYFDSWPQDDVAAVRFKCISQGEKGTQVSQDINDALLERFGPRNLRLFVAARAPISPSRLEACTKLVWLNLDNTRDWANKETINAIMKLPCLKQVSLGTCEQVTQQSLKVLREHPTIEALSLRGIANDEVVEHLSQIKSLKSLDLTGCNRVTSKGFESLVKNCKALETLEMACCNITQDGIKMVAALTSVRCLDIECVDIDDSAIQCIAANLPHLESLKVWDTDQRLTDATVMSLANLTKLLSFSFAGASIADPTAFDALSGLTQLQVLNVGETGGLTNDSLAFLQHLVNLHTIVLCCSALDDGMLLHLQAFKKLRRLDLKCCPNIAFHDASRVSVLTEIQSLDVSYTGIGDKSLENIGAIMTKMRWLRIYRCDSVSDKGLSFLRGMARLQLLDVCYCPSITVNGIMHCIEKMNHLKFVELEGTECDNEEDMAMIETRFPYVKLFGTEPNESDDSWDEEEEEY